MLLFRILLVPLYIPFLFANPENTTPAQNKAKRTIPEASYHYGEAPSLYYADQESAPNQNSPNIDSLGAPLELKQIYTATQKPLALVSVQQPIQVFEHDSPKQVAAQQVLYEFQQTPTNSVSNVHVKQLFQPTQPIDITTESPHFQSIRQPVKTAYFMQPPHPPQQNAPSNGYYNQAHAETVVSPVQHNLLTNHGQNTATFSVFNPLHPQSQQYQNTHVTGRQVPGKYLYFNGKIVYQPVQAHRSAQNQPIFQSNPHQPTNQQFDQAGYHQQRRTPNQIYANRHQSNQHVPVNPYIHKNHVTQKEFDSINVAPNTNNRFQPPKHVEQVDTPSVPLKRTKEKEEPEEVDEEDDDEKPENDDKEESNEEVEDDSDHDFEEDDDKFPYEDDDYHEIDSSYHYKPRKNGRKKEEESDEDDEEPQQKSSRYTPYYSTPKYHHRSYGGSSKTHKQPAAASTKIENVSSKKGGEYKTLRKVPKHIKPRKTHKRSERVYNKPTKVTRHAQRIKLPAELNFDNTPVKHKQKVYKERWFLEKDTEG